MTRQTLQMFAAPGAIWLAPIAAFLAVTSVACVEVNGGAVELSWSVRNFAGDRVGDDCQNLDSRRGPLVHVQGIRLAWKAVANGGDDAAMEPDGSADFACRDGRGITRFEVPVGRQMLWIVPLCADSAPSAGTYQVPPPIVRTIEEGAVTTLDALLVVAGESTCPIP